MDLALEITSNDELESPSGHVGGMVAQEQIPVVTEPDRILQQEFAKYMPSTRKPKTYDNVGVLMLSFDSTCEVNGVANMDVRTEIQELGGVLGDYNYDVTTEVIRPEDEAQAQVNIYLSQLRLRQSRYSHPLSILYYGGHGWRSTDKRRYLTRGFNFMPSTGYQREVPPTEGRFVMWETAESNLHDMKGDVLVILDCCDAGFLSFRGPGRSFEYLVACAEHKMTHPPGDNSFTAALIWALKELKADKPFTVQELKDKIRSHENFPKDQEPQIFHRNPHLEEPICISPKQSGIIATGKRNHFTNSDIIPEECCYVDFRFYFNQQITDRHAKGLARMMTPAIQDRNLDLNARHVSLIGHGTKPHQSRLLKVSKFILAANRFHRKLIQIDGEDVCDYDESHVRKRAKTDHSRKKSKSPESLEVTNANSRLITPISDVSDSDTETQIDVRLEPGTVSTVEVHIPPINTRENPSNMVEFKIGTKRKAN